MSYDPKKDLLDLRKKLIDINGLNEAAPIKPNPRLDSRYISLKQMHDCAKTAVNQAELTAYHANQSAISTKRAMREIGYRLETLEIELGIPDPKEEDKEND